ncbi:MAG: AraC family transcriptional regulator [Candidatus Obscuribacterales bacterium]|nr:AraC family transcriptional regulator [Candidatus Obscuribacterales bacterium]
MICPSDLVISPVLQSTGWRCGDRHEGLVVALSNQSLRELAFTGDLDFEIVFNAPVQDSFLSACMTELHREKRSSFPGGALYGDSIATTMAAHLLTHYSAARVRSTQAKGKFDSRTLNLVVDYLKTNACEGISLTQLASLAHMSPHHFLRTFKASTGMTPHQYLINHRVALGKDLLYSSDFTIKQVAKMVGFCDAGHFSRHFKRLTGVSPGVYAGRVAKELEGGSAEGVS